MSSFALFFRQIQPELTPLDRTNFGAGRDVVVAEASQSKPALQQSANAYARVRPALKEKVGQAKPRAKGMWPLSRSSRREHLQRRL